MSDIANGAYVVAFAVVVADAKRRDVVEVGQQRKLIKRLDVD